MRFVGDSIQEYINEIGKKMIEKYNISADTVIKNMLYTKFYGYIRKNYSFVKSKSPEYWAGKIHCLADIGEQFSVN